MSKKSGAHSPILVIGLSHKSAPVDVREKFAASGDVLPEVLARLRAHPELSEVLFLSTCNRVEVFASPHASASLADGARAVRRALASHVHANHEDELAPFLYERSGDEAIRHIFRVAASLDSMVLGEPQILGQVKDAYDAALAAGTLGNFLGRCVSRAFSVAKRVRTETALGTGSVSISSVAVDLAKRIFGDLENHSVLLVGAGEMAEAAAKSLGKGAKSIRVCNRNFERGAELAKQFGGGAAPFDALEDELIVSDVVVTSTGATSFIITRDMVKRAMKARKGRTLFLIDIAVPRNVDPSIHKIDNVYVYNVDDLERQVADGLRSRHDEVAAAETIVATELHAFEVWARGLDAQPAIVALRAKTRGVLNAELERTLNGRLKHLSEGDRAALVQMMDSAANKLLHSATTKLKAGAGEGSSTDLVRAAKELFDLPDVVSDADKIRGASEAPSSLDELDDDEGHVTH